MSESQLLKVLFYLEPRIEKGQPAWKDVWAKMYVNYIDHINKTAHSRYEFFLVLGDAQKHFIEQLSHLNNISFHIVSQCQLRAIYSSPSQQQQEMYENQQSESRRQLGEFYRGLLGDFEPDIIWSFVSPVPFFKDLFPDVLILNQELGMLGRSPLPLTWYLDPFGTFSNSLIARNFEQIKGFQIGRRERVFVAELRHLYRTAISKADRIKKSDIDPKNEFAFLALLPLQYNGHFIFDAMCDYDSQFALLTDVLDRTPKSIGVIVTEHKNPICDVVLHPSCVQYLSATYSNFIYKPELDKYTNSSLMILNIVDAVISVSSTLGMQGRFLGKALVALGESQLTPMASVGKLEDLYDFLSGAIDDHTNLDGFFYYLLSRYYIPEKNYLENGSWLDLYLTKMLDLHKSKKIDWESVPPIDTTENLLQFYRDKAMGELIVHEVQSQPATSTDVWNADNSDGPQGLKREMRNLRKENKVLKQAIEELRLSVSWKLTAPLRKLADILGYK